MADTPAPAPPAAPAHDEFALSLAKSIGKILTPEGRLADGPPSDKPPQESGLPGVTVDTKRFTSHRTLGDMAEEAERKAKEAAAAPPAPAAPAAPAATEPPAAPAAPAPAAPKLVKKPVAAPVQPPVAPPAAPTAPVLPPTPPADPDADYVAGLSADQQEEIKLAEYAETKMPELLKGKRAETLAYYRKVDKFVAEHQDLQPDSPEFTQFLEANKPKWTAQMKRKVERMQISEEVANTTREQVLKELRPDIEATKRRVREQELAPVISQAVEQFEEMVTTAPEADKDAVVIPVEVVNLINEKGYEAAAAEYPLEAPIFNSMKNAAQEYLRLSNGLTQFDPSNQVHAWLGNFVEQQGQIWKANPESSAGGKQFLTLSEYAQQVTRDPKSASNFYTFDASNVLTMLNLQANQTYRTQIRAAESSLARRAKKGVAAPAQPAPSAIPPVTPAGTPPAPMPPSNGTPPPASPRSRGSAAPGAAAPADSPLTEEQQFLRKAYPMAFKAAG